MPAAAAGVPPGPPVSHGSWAPAATGPRGHPRPRPPPARAACPHGPAGQSGPGGAPPCTSSRSPRGKPGAHASSWPHPVLARVPSAPAAGPRPLHGPVLDRAAHAVLAALPLPGVRPGPASQSRRVPSCDMRVGTACPGATLGSPECSCLGHRSPHTTGHVLKLPGHSLTLGPRAACLREKTQARELLPHPKLQHQLRARDPWASGQGPRPSHRHPGDPTGSQAQGHCLRKVVIG